jgi:NAD(P)H-flavin reductase
MERFFEVRLDSGKPLGHMPGQFVEVSIAGVGEAPISVSSPPSGKSFELVVRKTGRLTTVLHGLGPGSKIGIRGPFGTRFPVDDPALGGRDVLFVCGGIGLVPVRSAIRYVLQRRQDYGEVAILYGTKTPADRLFVSELAEWAGRADVKFLETVDRADETWTGNVGVITTLIPKVRIVPGRTVAIVCGPPVMYKFVIMSLYQANLPATDVFISLERRMKCGVGKCGHCQINGLYTCLHGPVFRYAEVQDVQEAV